MNNIIGLDRNIFGRDDKCELLIHSNTTNGSTVFVDSSKNGATITPYGSTHHSTAYSKIGGSSIKIPKKVGVTISGLTITPAFSLYNDIPWCIDFWIRRDAVVSGNGTTFVSYFTINANERIYWRVYSRIPAQSNYDLHGMWVYGINQLSNPATLASECGSGLNNSVGLWRRTAFLKHSTRGGALPEYSINNNGIEGDSTTPEAGSDYLYLNGQPTTFYLENLSSETDFYLDEIRMSVGTQRINYPPRNQSILERAY